MLESVTVWFFALLAMLVPQSDLPLEPSPHWTVVQPWSHAELYPSFRAESKSLGEVCSGDSDTYLVLPALIQGSQEIRVNGRPILLWNSPKFDSVESFYGTPFVRCSFIPEGAHVEWRVVSFTKYFARFDEWPRVSAKPPLANVFSRFLHTFAAGGMLALAVIVILVMNGKVVRRSALFLSGACASISLYFLAMESGTLGLSGSMQAVHKVADLSLWVGVSWLFGFLWSENLFNSGLYIVFNAMLVIALAVILMADTGDQIQMGTTLPFIWAPVLLGNALYRAVDFCIKSKLARRDVLVLLQVICFACASLNDIFMILGVWDTVPMLPVGLISVLFLAIMSVERQLAQTYIERDYLRQNLELEVATKTKSLEETLVCLKQAQAEVVQSAKLAGLGTLAAGIAHEINNSLNYVNGSLAPLTKIVERSTIDPESRQKVERLLQVMKTGLTLTAGIISNLKTYTHTGGEYELVKARELIEGVLSIIKSKMNSEIKVVVDVAPGLLVYADRVALSQVIMNLTDNAIDALMELSGEREIRFSGGMRGSSTWLSVVDNGPGIPPEIVENIYDPFFTTKPVGKGTGLGLYIVRNEITKCGGSVDIRRRPEGGTEFVLTLPGEVTKVAA